MINKVRFRKQQLNTVVGQLVTIGLHLLISANNFHGPLNCQRPIALIQNSYPICHSGSAPLPYNGQQVVKIIEQKGQTKLYQFLGLVTKG
jgi:hypothetical protein